MASKTCPPSTMANGKDCRTGYYQILILILNQIWHPLKHPYYGSYRWNCSNYICAFLSWMNLEHAHHASSRGSNSDNLSPITPVLWGRSLWVFSKCRCLCHCHCLSHCIGLCHFPGPTRATSNTPQATEPRCVLTRRIVILFLEEDHDRSSSPLGLMKYSVLVRGRGAIHQI